MARSKDDIDSSILKHKNFTVDSFLNNPTGDAGTNAIARKLVLEKYVELLNKLRKDGKEIKAELITASKSLFIKLSIPSETFENFHYDVMVEFEDYNEKHNDLATNRIRFFSNSPSFVFSFAHVFEKYGLLVQTLKSKYNEKVFEELPVVKNPDFSTFYEKSITMALLYIRDKGLLNISQYKDSIKKIPLSKVKDNISTDVEKLNEYNKQKKIESDRKKEEKRLKSIEAKKEKALKKQQRSELTSKVSSKVSNKVSKEAHKSVSKKVNNKINQKVDSVVKNKKVK